MKKISLLSALVLVFSLTACDTVGSFGDANTANQLVDASQRRITDANVSVVATFKVDLPGQPSGLRESGPGINSEGKETGTCTTGGRWQNPSTRKFAAAIPHAHCMGAATLDLTIGLENIDAKHSTAVSGNNTARTSFELLLDEAGGLRVFWDGSSNQSRNHMMIAGGTMTAHAVDQSGTRHGTFTIGLSQYATPTNTTNFFETFEAETEDGGVNVFGLSKVITAVYTEPDGTTHDVQGRLYWTESI